MSVCQSIGHQLRCELFVSQGANLPFASPAPNPPISSLLKGNKSNTRKYGRELTAISHICPQKEVGLDRFRADLAAALGDN